jgi:uncharacterized protein YciI
MYTLIVNITKPDLVEAQRPPHNEWVKKYFENGLFLIAGPKTDKTGGVIITKPINKSDLEKILITDPYITEDVAEYEIIEFECKLTQQQLDFLKTLDKFQN